MSPIPVTQRQGPNTRLLYYPETAWGTDPGTPVGYVLPLREVAGFGSAQNIIEAPIFTGNRLPDGAIHGNINADGSVPLAMEFETLPFLVKDFFGAAGYSRPGGGTTTLHRFRVNATSQPMGSGQLQSESLETTAQYIRHKGVRPGSFSFPFATEGVPNVDVTFMGGGDEAYTSLAGTVNDLGYAPGSYFNGDFTINGVDIVGLTELSQTWDTGLSRQDVGFNQGLAGSVNYGKVNANGRVGLLMATDGSTPEANMTFYNYAVNQQEIALDCIWADAPLATATKWMRVIYSTVKFGRNSWKPGGNAGLIIAQDWRMVRSANSKIAAEKFGTVVGTYNMTAANNVIGIKVDGGATTSVTCTTSATKTVDAIVAEINANGTLSPLILALNFMGRVMIRHRTKAVASTLQIDTAVANSAHTLLGFDGVVFTGFENCPILVEFYNSKATNY